MAEDKTEETPQDKADKVLEKNVRAQAAKDNAIGAKNARRQRFVGGVLYSVEELDAMSPEDLEQLEAVANHKGVAKTTPIGNMSVEELEAELERRKNGGKAPKPQLDHDKDGGAGGSLSKAQIATKLTELGVDFDATASRDDLAKTLAAAQKK
jgi:predicted RecB family endonuclease